MNPSIVALPVAIPLFAAALTLVAGRRPRAQLWISVVALTLVLAVATVLLIQVEEHGTIAFSVGGWPPPIGIELVADRLSVLMVIVSAAVTLAVLVYSQGQGISDANEETPLSIYHPTYLVLVAGVANAFLAGDLFNLFVGFEILLGASYVLITLGGTRSRVRAGTTYVVVGVISSTLFLIAIALIYAATGTVNMAQLSIRLADVAVPVALGLQAMLLVAFAIKAAIFPLSAWLPDSYPTAPAPITAVFAGLLTKVGVYAILRTQTLLFPEGRLDSLLMWAGLLTMIVGILGAVAQSDIKRMLSFTLVSHIGFIVFGIGLATTDAVSAAMYYVIHHIIVQTTLFLIAGLVERTAGTTSIPRLGGLARLAPFLAAIFLVSAFNLSGIPPLSGFLGKLGLMEAAVDKGGWLSYVLVAGGIVTTLLTLFAIGKVWNGAFWQAPPDRLLRNFGVNEDGVIVDEERSTKTIIPPGMMIPTTALVALALALTVFAGPIFEYTQRASQELIQRTPYIEAVFNKDAINQEVPR